MIRLRTLGALHLHDSEGRDTGVLLAQPKRLALLAYLALALPRGPQRRDSLVALFWPEQDADHARNALNQSLHVIRRSLGTETVASANGDALSLNPTLIWCDAIAFEEALDSGHLADAIDLYRGDLLEGFHVAAAPEFERWLETERTRLRGRYHRGLEMLAEQCEARRDFTNAVIQWRRLAAQDPYSSRVTLRLMRALAAAGDPAAAVQHARVHETLLRDELEIAPDPEIESLVRQLQTPKGASLPLRADVGAHVDLGPPPVASVQSAPTPPTFFSGRRHRRVALIVVGGIVTLFVAGGAVALANSRREPSAPRIRSLAVLPLENLSGDSTQQVFADGMHDALITELGRYPELSVISRTTMMQYRGTTKNLSAIARELKVDGVVEGAVLHEGGKVRMTAQLLHGASDRHVWAESYRRDLRDILVLQQELAQAIAREVRVATSPLERPYATTTGPPNEPPDEIYLRELFLKGRHAEVDRTPRGTETARKFYEMAIERDSGFALAYAGLAGIYEVYANYGFAAKRPSMDSARMMARRAVELDSTLPEARTALAVTLGGAGQFAAAEREFKRAIELGPSNARAHYWYAILLVALDRGEEALAELERTAQLDPFVPRGVIVMQRYATFLVTGERPHLKLPAGSRWSSVYKLVPGEPWVRATDAVELAISGRCREARAEIAEAQRIVPDVIRMLHNAARVYRYCGDSARARGVMEQMKRHPGANDQGQWIAGVHAEFGETDSAFVWLERHVWTMAELTDPRASSEFDSIRSDPRYAQLLRRVGLQ
jgi:TolB-like protein/DNA-binding SARP family transcriptional activator/Flp pilus assembly protein TadD